MRFLALLSLTAWLLSCSGAHDSELIEVRSNDCYTCHTPEFVAASAPPHLDIYPTECALCHNNTSWVPADFDHINVRDRECRLCHQADYDATADPVHEGKFPPTCDYCHTTDAWRPALDGIHPESEFPIGAGAHKNIACVTCHDLSRGPSTNGDNTDCIGCHEHSANRVNEEHHEVRDYVFDANTPNFCLRCHPRGRH